jgi:hypothetical protein
MLRVATNFFSLDQQLLFPTHDSSALLQLQALKHDLATQSNGRVPSALPFCISTCNPMFMIEKFNVHLNIHSLFGPSTLASLSLHQ